jgi:uncharacterized damage-inducible protein DinB
MNADGGEPVTAPEAIRSDPQRVSDERTMLDEWLEYHRATLLRKCAGLDDEQLRRRSCEPSGLSLLGLVRHLTDVERGWFLRGVGGGTWEQVPPMYFSRENPDGDFEDLDTADPQAVFAGYEQACADARTVTAGAGLDDTFHHRDTTYSVRWVYLHMIEEYARHNGHADLLRERIDGATGD